MKKVLVAVAAVLLSVAAQAGDGQLILNNHGAGAEAPIKFSGGALDGQKPGAGFSAQLFLVAVGGSLTALTPITTFRTGNAAGYFTQFTPVVKDFGTANGTATFRLMAYDGTSYDTALTYHGFSADFSAAVAVTPNAPSLATGLQSFNLTPVNNVPEPTTLALAALGGAALLIRRRK